MGYRRRLHESERLELRKVYRATVGSVYAFFCYSVDAGDAEDLTAATYERVVRSWGSFDPARARVNVWVLAIARNILRDHLRRQAHRRGPSLDEHPALAAHLASSDDGVAKFIATDAFASWLKALPPRDREVLALRFGADLSTEEIARAMDLSVANVQQIASRALRRLRATSEDPYAVVNGSASRNASRLAAGT